MRVAVISDVHGNRPAFEAVLDDIDRHEPDELWCLGDLVGYGAEPDACVALAAEHAAICLVGNHDLAVRGDLSIEEFSRGAALAASWTKEVILPESLDYLAALEPQRIEDEDVDVALYHASPRDPVWEYVLSTLLAELCFDVQPRRIALIGHSHVALSFWRRPGEPATGETQRGGSEVALGEGQWLLNPGSVGQPRDGDPRAAWMLLDLGAATAAFHRIDYDIAAAQDAIRAARLPDSLAERLLFGQ